MNPMPSSMMLIGVGGAGGAMVRRIVESYGHDVRAVIIDTDAMSGGGGNVQFSLLGGNRLAGRGTGGQPPSARAAFQDDPSVIDPMLEGVRTAVVVTALGGGTGGGASGELLKHLHTLGITTLIFATLPFSFEGEARSSSARAVVGPIEQNADVSVFLRLDDLVSGTDNMKEALDRAISTVASGVMLLWRLVDRPGYIMLDAERLHRLLAGRGRARFAVATASGSDRANEILASFAANPRLLRDGDSSSRVRSVLLGILAGDDLRLSEIAAISSGITATVGGDSALELGTVNDEETFSGVISAVILVFDEVSSAPRHNDAPPATRRAAAEHDALSGDQRFRNAERTLWNGEDLDIPTYIRRQLTLDR